MILLATAAASILGAIGHGAFHRNSRIFGSVMSDLSTHDRVVALTFDDGPNPDATPLILDCLADYAVPATFFVLGSHVDRWPDLVRRIVRAGHQIGNHGYFHRRLHLKSPGYIKRDVVLGKRAIERAAGTSPHFFRAPHGFRNPWVTPIARSLSEITVGWSLGVWDSDRPGSGAIVNRTLAGARPGSIILLHDGDGYDPGGDRLQTAEALEPIIVGLKKRNFGFAGLPDPSAMEPVSARSRSALARQTRDFSPAIH